MKTRNRKTATRTATASPAPHRHAPLGRLAWLVLLCLLVLPAAMRAQCPAVNTAFLPGERVSYDLYFNWKFVWIKVGEARMGITEDYWQSQPAYRIRLESVTSKKADLFFKMRDTLTCYVSRNLEPLYFCKAAEEGKRHTVDEAWFSYRDGKSHAHQRRTWYKPQRPTDETDHVEPTCIFDMLSILAQARSWNPDDYKVGDKIHFPMTTGRKVEPQTLIYRGKENVEANDKKTYRCLVFSFVEYDKKGKEEEVITFFISDDKNHLPVRLDMYLNFGSAKAFLNGVQGNRYPLSSVVKKK